MRGIAQPGEDGSEFGGQDIAAIHRDHLPQLHCCSAQPRKLLGHAHGVSRGQQQVGQMRALAARQPPHALGQYATSDPARQLPETGQPRKPGAGDFAVAPAVHRSHACSRGRSRRNTA